MNIVFTISKQGRQNTLISPLFCFYCFYVLKIIDIIQSVVRQEYDWEGLKAQIIQIGLNILSLVKSSFRNLTPNIKVQLEGSQCMLLISVGQEAHEGDRLASTITLLNRYFHSCVVLLYDSLQRHTMSLNTALPAESFHEQANEAGDAWIQRNQRYLDKLNMPYTISRWDGWISQAPYLQWATVLKNAFSQDNDLQNIFQETVHQYLDRYKQRPLDFSNFDLQRASRICLEYLVEECAVLCLWPELNCQFEIYPNAHNQAMEATRAKYVTPNYPHLLQSLSLRFRHAKQLKPQHFSVLAKEEELVTE